MERIDKIQKIIRDFSIYYEYINPETIIDIGLYFCDKYGKDKSIIKYSTTVFDRVEFCERTEIHTNKMAAWDVVVEAYQDFNDVYAMATILYYVEYRNYKDAPDFFAQNEDILQEIVNILENIETKDEFIYFLLARAYKTGRGIDSDDEKAIEYYEKAYNLGLDIAILFACATKDDDEGLFKHASEIVKKIPNNHIVNYYLGVCYFYGLGTEINDEQAVKYLKHTEKIETYNEDPYDAYFMESRYLLGICYFKGYGVKKDIKKACELFRFAASKYTPISYYCQAIATLILNDDQIPAYTIVNYLKKAAEANYYPAIRKLLLCYENNYGCDNDKEDYEKIKTSYEEYKKLDKSNYDSVSLIGIEADKCDLIESKKILDVETKTYKYVILKKIKDDLE